MAVALTAICKQVCFVTCVLPFGELTYTYEERYRGREKGNIFFPLAAAQAMLENLCCVCPKKRDKICTQ